MSEERRRYETEAAEGEEAKRLLSHPLIEKFFDEERDRLTNAMWEIAPSEKERLFELKQEMAAFQKFLTHFAFKISNGAISAEALEAMEAEASEKF